MAGVSCVLTACAGGEDTGSAAGPGAQNAGIETGAFCESIASPLNDPPTFYESNPTQEDADDVALSYADPSALGLDASMLEQAASELESKPFVNSLLVARRGQVAMERYFNGSQASDSNNVHSSSKSLMGLVAGAAIADGHIQGLEQKASALLPDLFADVSQEKRGITVGDLLTMSAGFQWIEDVSEYTLQDEPDWLQAIVELPLSSSPGEQFNYSTSQSHLMGAAIAHATGMSLCDYTHQAILEPLGIRAERWGRDPQGYFSGGYNVYMTPRELMRFGQLVLDRGAWEGRQLVSAEWVEAATSEQIYDGGLYWYGYYFWLWRPDGGRVDIAWGYGGQLVYVLPEQEMVVVITTNTRDYDPDYDGSELVWEKIAAAAD